MRARRWAAFAAMVVSMVVVAAPAGAAVDPPAACQIERPSGLWPPYFYDDYWNTYTHGGFNSDWVAHPRPVGTVKAVMLFVDFPDRPASAVTQTSPIDYRQPQAYYEFLKQSVRVVPDRVLRALQPRDHADLQVVPDAAEQHRVARWTTASPTRAAAERRGPGRVHGGRGGGRRRRGRLQPATT